jgi:hypothetical protein
MEKNREPEQLQHPPKPRPDAEPGISPAVIYVSYAGMEPRASPPYVADLRVLVWRVEGGLFYAREVPF